MSGAAVQKSLAGQRGTPRADAHRSTSTDIGARTGRCIGTLEELLIQHVSARMAEECAPPQDGPILLYGAGRHSWWLLGAAARAMGDVTIAAVIDDAAEGEGEFAGLPLMRPRRAAERFGKAAAVILSTDAWQETMTRSAHEAFGAGVRVIDLYRGLPPGPYMRGEGAYTRDAGGSLTRPTELCLRRCAAAMADWIRRSGLRAPMLIGKHWQTFAAADALRGAGVRAVVRAGSADCAIVCDDAMERSGPGGSAPLIEAPEELRGPVLTMRSGEREWFGRAAPADMSSHTRRDQRGARPGGGIRTRFVIRHDNHLGDVVLSQGILPERIKTEIDAEAHITFVTTRSAPTRHGSASTGWCLDLIAENPWIDEIVDAAEVDRGRRIESDVAYTITDSGDVYDHVFDHHAMKVELPPGRTDARVYLSDEDGALAKRVLRGAKRPLVAVNMSLTGQRFRAWGDEKTRELCERIETRHGATVVWMGWVPFGRFARLADGDRPLTAREQCAVLAACDVHVCAQGAGANLSAAVGTQTLALSGCHPAHREGAAYFWNPSVADPSRRHVEMYRYCGATRVLTYATRRDVEWRVRAGETRDEVFAFARELWDRETPFERLPPEERFGRVRGLSVDEVEDVLGAMLRAPDGRRRPGGMSVGVAVGRLGKPRRNRAVGGSGGWSIVQTGGVRRR